MRKAAILLKHARGGRRERSPLRPRRLTRLRAGEEGWTGTRAPLLAINFADDVINPPELGLLERGITKVKKGRAVVVPLSEKTRGHATHSMPELWKDHLARLLAGSER